MDYLSAHLRTMAPHRAILRAVECKLMSRVELRHPVLDVGCGDGHFASICYREPIDVGIDVHLGDAMEAAARPGVYRSVMIASATALPFADSAFGTVVSNCVLEHIPDIDGALAEIARVLRPDGELAITLPGERYGDLLLGSTMLRLVAGPAAGRIYGNAFNRISRHHHVDPPEVWGARLAQVGLEMVEQEYYFSPRAHRAFDLSHYLGVPNLVSRKLTGRWVLHPAQMALFWVWLRRYYEEKPVGEGAYQFVRCRRI